MSPGAHGKSSTESLVIFGCGYIGTAVARWAVERGIPVTALTRNHQAVPELRTAGVNAVVADAADERWHEQLGVTPRFVLNCLAASDSSVAGYRRSYLAAMDSITRWASSRGTPESIVYTSSTSVYPQDGGARVDECAPASARDERSEILIATELRLMDAVGASRRRFILRLAGIYGPARHHVLDQVRCGVVSGSSDHHLNLAFRDDIVSAIVACFQAPAGVGSNIFNVVDDEPAPKREVVAWLAHELGRPEPAFTGQPVPSRRAVTPDRIILNAKLKATLGWQPAYPSYREGYRSIMNGLG